MKNKDYKYLFLDRDGVINRRIIDDYIKTPQEFQFLDGVPEAMKCFATHFDVIVIVTNQQGIGKGLMTHEDFHAIMDFVHNEIHAAGGRIDDVFYCPYLKTEHPFTRKPNVGMGLQARKKYPQIRFKESIMVGDSLSDMEFGKKLGMHTVLVGEKKEYPRRYPTMIDEYHADLWAFAQNYHKRVSSK